jgi:hypothetical protein
VNDAAAGSDVAVTVEADCKRGTLVHVHGLQLQCSLQEPCFTQPTAMLNMHTRQLRCTGGKLSRRFMGLWDYGNMVQCVGQQRTVPAKTLKLSLLDRQQYQGGGPAVRSRAAA